MATTNTNREVPAVLTPMTRVQVEQVLRAAWQLVYGTIPSVNQLALVTAQSALETGNWHRMYGYNFGNLVASGWTGAVQHLPNSSYEGGFRAYTAPESGAVDLLELFDKRQDWREGVKTGNPRAFMDALNNPPRYCTAKDGGPCRSYGQDLERLFVQYGGKLPPSTMWPIILGFSAAGALAWWYRR